MSTPENLLVPAADDPNWWRQATVYQIYPRSFADADGNSIGDLKGITSRVPYLKKLGVDAVWLSPFYPSQLADGGYDVDDFRNVDPKIGSLEDFDEMSRVLHEAGIKLIVDVVPNHSSDQHVWFTAALAAGPGSSERDRYVFRDGLGEQGELPPSDWESIFGGPAWEQVEDGQWYLHIFAKEQPDLNWRNPEVHQDFLDTFRFWADRGVDGFRIDVAHGLAKGDMWGDLPSEAELQKLPKDGTHPIWDRDEVHEIYREWRTVFNEYTPPRTAVAEAWVERDRRPAYASPEGLGQAFNFDLLTAHFDADEFKKIVTENLELSAESGSSSTWVLSNHDVVRHPTRYGLPFVEGKTNEKVGHEWLLAGGPESQLDRVLGLARARAATLFELALPGSAYLYQGEELGLHEVADIPDSQRQDPTFFNSPGVNVGRDGCRVPLPWKSRGTSYGFGPDTAHLPQPTWFADAAVSLQDAEPTSTLNLYRAALAARRKLQGAEELEWLETDSEQVLAFRRPSGWVNVTNFGDQPIELPTGQLVLASAELVDDKLPGPATAWLQQ
ncbi:glycoside hydrolase family 13 protein [Rothia sp. (in: high G+C Gram-positive bacteria)]|uniref:glycoside hydrolase family 13 protein n=1 Tax=Rothia sp. (in: high G+C Gram-positive bacteria) TaxID=1885016 RepID=UPI000EBC4807|nr:alpha-amylase [Rothia sp. (in: high G+C Gram-positive bacteria)]